MTERAAEHVARGFLVAALRHASVAIDDRLLEALDDTVWDRVLSQATTHHVRTLFYQRLMERKLASRIPARIDAALEEATRHVAQRNLLRQADLAAMARLLAAADIPLIALKGAYLARAVYDSPAMREMVDVDVLVRREHLQRAVDLLRTVGYAAPRPFSVDVDAAVHSHVTGMSRPGGAGCVEIHWSITVPTDLAAIDPAQLWRRAVPLEVSGAPMLSLSPEDLLLHLCHHAAYQHSLELGLKPFCDIAETIRRHRDRIDWNEVVHRAVAWQWTRPVYLMLALARELLGADVPEHVLTVLAPADVQPQIIALAGDHVLTHQSPLTAADNRLALLSGPGSLSTKVRHTMRRAFPPRREIAAFHGVAPQSRLIEWYYLTRLGRLWRSYGRLAVRLLWFREPGLVSVATRKNRLHHWLRGGLL